MVSYDLRRNKIKIHNRSTLKSRVDLLFLLIFQHRCAKNSPVQFKNNKCGGYER